MTWKLCLKRAKDPDNMGITSLRAQLLIRHPSQLANVKARKKNLEKNKMK